MRNKFKLLSLVILVSISIYGVVYNFNSLSEWLKHPSSQMATVVQPAIKIVAPEYFIDVWKLREDVAVLEPLVATNNFDHCYTEGEETEGEESDPSQALSQKETDHIKELAQKEAEESKTCVADIEKNYQVYTQALDVFSRAWLPKLYKAIESGDPVAEVIMRQCDTTTVLDRSNIESTCDPKPERRAVAVKRLKEIGFAPAFDWAYEYENRKLTDPEALKFRKLLDEKQLTQEQYREKERLALQNLLLEQFGEGVFGDYSSKRYDVADNSMIKGSQYTLITAIAQSVPRAFSFSPALNEWATTAFSRLSLVRKPMTPSVMTWGSALFSRKDSKPTIDSGYYREKWRNTNVSKERYKADSSDIVYKVRELVAKSEANIDRYLMQDKRWGVFLLNRVGQHEWVPEGMQSDSHKLSPNFVGEWKLEKMFQNWTDITGYFYQYENMESSFHGANIYLDGEYTRIKFQTASTPNAAPIEDGECVLRYSGGQTFLPKVPTVTNDTQDDLNSQDWSNTMLGDLKRNCHNRRDYVTGAGNSYIFGKSCSVKNSVIDGNKAAFAPFDPTKLYQQVLVQCTEGESTDSDQIRFVLLEGDTLVEFTALDPFQNSLYIRHYRRIASKTVEPVLKEK